MSRLYVEFFLLRNDFLSTIGDRKGAGPVHKSAPAANFRERQANTFPEDYGTVHLGRPLGAVSPFPHIE